MTICKIASIAACLCALLQAPAKAAVVWADAVSGVDSGTCGPSADPCKTLQFAIDRSANGDTVRAKPGTYNEFVSMAGRQITLLADAYATSGNRSTTIIDCAAVCDADSGFYIAPVYVGNGSTLTGFTIKNAGGTGVEGAGSVTITQNIITANQALGTYRGGGISVYSTTAYTSTATLRVEGNDVVNNSAPELGGGIFVRTKTAAGRGLRPVVIQNNRIVGNSTLLPKGRGSGVYVRAESDNGGSTSVVITQNLITGNANTAGADPVYYPWGGGISAAAYGYGTHNIAITNNTIESNHATVGGGVALFTSLNPTATAVIQFSGNTVQSNTAYDPSGVYGFGGGVFAYTFGFGYETITIDNNTVSANLARVFGGGLDLRTTPSELGIQNLTASNNEITENESDEWGGGVFAFLFKSDVPSPNTASLSLVDNTISSNTAAALDIDGLPIGRGGGLFAQASAARSTAPGVTMAIQGNDVQNNVCNLVGAGINFSVVSSSLPAQDDPTSVAAPAESIVLAKNNLITGNVAASPDSLNYPAAGGGVFAYGVATGQASSTLRLDFNTVSENTSDIGAGGIEIESNTAADDVLNVGVAAVAVSNSIVTANDGFGVGGPVPGDIGIITPGGTGALTVSLDYNDFFANGGGNYESWIGNPTGANGNLSVDPEFDDNFDTSRCSPVIDAADPAADYSSEPAPNGNRANMGHAGGSGIATAALADINGDLQVDGIDILRIATSFGAISPNPRYSVAADLDEDGQVDGDDLASAAAQFGESCP